ncbi:nucleoside triphosphate pyrophosphohydrolase [Hazenella coriacea]|uniref:Putative house-cleaning noncanonical NTP pyrophosphatase (MazG superfamily) n=1 Tax=Hazenella coriacea TaxID=1179467 RepID=A0A4R3L820_9BACL|nr:nucleoside triphosphate pyrophosphohydrolase [Hazenella coriacea]TCS95789.1 putative house-cleaning noncanonical NTP pyrophosphatase (MazG superfamily) [Hazenella coriacea]
MAEKIYNKLVRDKIPQIIKQSNQEPFTYTATKEEIKPMLYLKLTEELEEFKDTPNEEELADMLEVIDGLVHAFHLDMNKVLAIKAQKKEERGGFKEGIVLEKVRSDD